MREPSRTLLSSTVVAAAAGILARRVPGRLPKAALEPVPRWGWRSRRTRLPGKPVPFLRWSFIRMMAGMKHLTREWQVGDGREDALAAYVAEHARRDDIDDVIRVIDKFCHEQSLMMNVGDEKGELLDAALRSAQPKRVLELGAYCGYSALRMARATAPETQIYTVEFSAANADIARRNLDHAGVSHRVEVVVGSLRGRRQDAESPAHGQRAHGRLAGLRVPDHAKEVYLSDLALIVEQGLAAPRVGGGRRQRRVSLARPPTAPTCANRRAARGERSSTRRTSSTRRWFLTSCWSRPTFAGRADALGGPVRPVRPEPHQAAVVPARLVADE